MISFVEGTLTQKNPTEIVVDVHGVGYLINIPLSTFEKIQHTSGIVRILTYMHVREDAMQLYGFATEDERSMFRLLISVSGIGPKMAQGILSGLNTDELKRGIIEGNIHALTSISGVGKKTAERLIIELRDKISKTEITEKSSISSTMQMKTRAEAVVALMSLGYSRSSAEQSLRTVLNESPNKDIPVEELIKAALRHASK